MEDLLGQIAVEAIAGFEKQLTESLPEMTMPLC
jgi:hypothetical protein